MLSCKVCKKNFNNEPLVILNNVPKGAQVLLKYENINDDRGVDLKIYQCPFCGTVQTDCHPVEYYKEVITSVSYSDEMMKFRTKQIQDFLNRFNLCKKKILEVGCGKGVLLDIIKQLGGIPYGVEEAMSSVNKIKKRGISIKQGYVDENFNIEDEHFDAFLIINFLEHSPEPSSMLRGIYNNLKDDAVGIIEVPNFTQVIRKMRFYDFIADHLVYYTKETLKLLIETNGFVILDLYETWKGDDIVAIVKKRKNYNLKELFKDNNTIIQELKNFVDSKTKTGEKVAVWGASHQALTLISMAQVHNIEFIVDSAVFKQGKYAPVTHIPIVNPHNLYSNKIDHIIVMAAGYSNEVVDIIMKMDINVNVFVLKDNKIEIINI